MCVRACVRGGAFLEGSHTDCVDGGVFLEKGEKTKMGETGTGWRRSRFGLTSRVQYVRACVCGVTFWKGYARTCARTCARTHAALGTFVRDALD